MKKINLKASIQSLGLNYKKEILLYFVIIFALFATGVAFYILYPSLFIIIVCLSIILAASIAYFYRYTILKRKQEEEHNQEFVNMLSYFQNYLSYGHNVYQAFLKTSYICDSWMREKLNEFLSEIDNDKTILPFLKFAELFTLSDARNAMISIYQMVDSGSDFNELAKFNYIFSQMMSNKTQFKKEQKRKSLDSYMVLPLICSGFIMILIIIGVVSTLGEFSNVI